MKSKEEEFKELFLAEAQENQQELEKLFTELEKNHTSKRAIEAIFRITHTLKANAAGMGYDEIATMAHLLEDVFSAIKHNRLTISSELFNDLFRTNDILGSMIQRIQHPDGPKIKYRGIKTKLEVLLQQLKEPETSMSATSQPNKEIPLERNEIHLSPSPAIPASVSIPDLGSGFNGQSNPALMAEMDTLVLEEEPNEPWHVANGMEESKITISENIHIPVRKLDDLMNLVGELIIEKDRVIALSLDNNRKANDYARLQRITSELQYSVMDVRLVQVAVLFNKFHRIVRDVATLEGKQVNLVLEGTENEIDRNVLQIISDSLIHLVRNSVSHGIETEHDRVKAKKPSVGTVRLSARSEKEEVIIDVSDDGKGINPVVIRRKAVEKGLITEQIAKSLSDEDIIQLIFEPGFSSVEQVTAVSGRGVGMDVVKKAIDSIGGRINVHSIVNEGTTISLSLPSSMAVKNALLFELGAGDFAIPLVYTDAVISLYRKDIHKVGSGLLAKHLKKNISIVFLNDLFSLENNQSIIGENTLQQSFDRVTDEEKLYVIVVSYNNREVGFVVDKLLQQKEIVEKPLGQFFEEVKFVSGATIMGNGKVCLVLDAPSIMNFLFRNVKLNKS
ncbi:MAG: chemotaxis protein CheA [Bacteroidota bacterium]